MNNEQHGELWNMFHAEYAQAEAQGKLEEYKSKCALLFSLSIEWAMERHSALLQEILGQTQPTRAKR